jgi:hypothetical protein
LTNIAPAEEITTTRTRFEKCATGTKQSSERSKFIAANAL